MYLAQQPHCGEFLATPDTGADVTIMGPVQFNLLGITRDQPEAPLGQGVFAASGQPLDCLGTFNLTFHLGSRSVDDRVTVVDSVDGVFLAWYVARDLGILPGNYPTPLPPHTKATRLQVNSCQVRQPSQQKEPTDPLPRRVFEVASADFFSHAGHTYLVYTNQLYGWMEIAQLPSATARSTIRTLTAWFCRLGIPTTLRTDGSPPHSSHNLRKFLDRWGVTHVPSQPHNPQSNECAEANVEKMQLLLRSTAPDSDINNADFQHGLLELRITPDASGRSPAEILLGHQFCSSLPIHETGFAREWSAAIDHLVQRTDDRGDTTIRRYTRRSNHLGPLNLGSSVCAQDLQSNLWDRVVTVVSNGQHHTYCVRLPSGCVLWCHRRYLRQIPPASPSPETIQPPAADQRENPAPHRSTATPLARRRLTL